MNNFIVSIDGTSGSGKERIAKYISRKYNFYHLDSGILYRRITSIILKKKINIKKKKELINLLNKIEILSPRRHRYLRSEEISKKTSLFATNPIIRNFVNKQQKIIVKKRLKTYAGCVIDGRDIGSKVFKKAKIKLFIVVQPILRAKRRHKQLIEQGEKSIYSRILKGIILRDKTDKKRKISPLVVPINAIYIDNSLDFKNTISQVNQVLEKKL